MSTAQKNISPKYYSQAQRLIHDRDGARRTSQEEVENIAQYLRNQDLLRAIEPYLKERQKIVTNFFSLQTDPHAQIPEQLKLAVAMWDEIIAIEARNFGYEGTP